MIERRDVVSGGLLGLTALVSGGDAALATQSASEDMVRALTQIREVLERRLSAPFVELAEIRRQQREFLKASQKFPDFIEIGIDVWERLYDWHVRNHMAPVVARRDDGRYTMAFIFTTLVLRPELMDSYVGFGYDAR
jgi:hypothetical protein